MLSFVKGNRSKAVIFPIALCLSQFNFSIAAFSDCELPKLKQSMKFHKAREMLLDAGWQGLRKYPLPDKSGMVGYVFYDLGYSEVVDCAGTGVAPCIFVYKNANGKKLEVHTYGEENLVLDTWGFIK
jgi:hypothetical protein